MASVFLEFPGPLAGFICVFVCLTAIALPTLRLELALPESLACLLAGESIVCLHASSLAMRLLDAARLWSRLWTVQSIEDNRNTASTPVQRCKTRTVPVVPVVPLTALQLRG